MRGACWRCCRLRVLAQGDSVLRNVALRMREGRCFSAVLGANIHVFV